MMFVDCCVGGGRYFLYYSYRRNPTGICSRQNLLAVKLLSCMAVQVNDSNAEFLLMAEAIVATGTAL